MIHNISFGHSCYLFCLFLFVPNTAKASSTMDYTITLGNVELSFIPKASKTPPKISSEEGGGLNSLEEVINVLNFSGKIKIKAIYNVRQGAGVAAAAPAAAKSAFNISASDPSSRIKKGLGMEILKSMKPRSRDSSANISSNEIGKSGRTIDKAKSTKELSNVMKPEDIEKMTTPLHICCSSLNPKVCLCFIYHSIY